MSTLRRFVFSPPGPSSVFAITAMRIFFGLALALGHGTNKFPVGDRFISNVADLGFPAPVFFAWAAAVSELFGGVLLAIGLLTRVASLFILVTMGVAAFMANDGVWAKAELAYIFGIVSVFFLAHGGGRYSVDAGLDSR